jgi:hypothetical protein
MAYDNSEIQKLEEIDLLKLSVADLHRMKNSMLRDALLAAVGRAARGPVHNSHGMHTDHVMDVPTR